MTVDPPSGSDSGDTPSAADDALLAERFIEVVAGLVANDLTFDFISENEDEG